MKSTWILVEQTRVVDVGQTPANPRAVKCRKYGNKMELTQNKIKMHKITHKNNGNMDQFSFYILHRKKIIKKPCIKKKMELRLTPNT
jgi:hypothetical protein